MYDKKIALVTGASKGIGRAIALRLAKDGMHVIANYNGSKDEAQETKTLIENQGGTCEIMQFNVGETGLCSEAIEQIILKYGRIDVLVNNAGITKDDLIMKMSESDFDKVINTNLKGVFNTSKAVSRKMMKQRSGRIINISSVSGILGNAGQCNYAASKAGVIGFTKSLARELASRNITVNAVAPGFVETQMTIGLSDLVIEKAKTNIPLGCFGKPEDVANAVAFFAAKDSSYITGQVLCVDGGMAI